MKEKRRRKWAKVSFVTAHKAVYGKCGFRFEQKKIPQILSQYQRMAHVKEHRTHRTTAGLTRRQAEYRWRMNFCKTGGAGTEGELMDERRELEWVINSWLTDCSMHFWEQINTDLHRALDIGNACVCSFYLLFRLFPFIPHSIKHSIALSCSLALLLLDLRKCSFSEIDYGDPVLTHPWKLQTWECTHTHMLYMHTHRFSLSHIITHIRPHFLFLQ